MNRYIKDYFTFNQRERKGIYVLISLQVALILFNVISAEISEKGKEFDFSVFENEIRDLEESLLMELPGTLKNKNRQGVSGTKVDIKRELFYFDPNHLSDEKWLQLGVTEKQLKTIRNFKLKGGRFYKKEDLKKIYVISDKLYSKLEPYIIFNRDSESDKAKEEVNKAGKYEILELNIASKEALEQLPGIGAVLSDRIIKYRQMLGGFHIKEQLFEVYGVDSNLFNKLVPYISVDEELIKRININTATFKMLLKHPYLDYEMTKSLVEFRSKKGKFQSLEDIMKINCIFDSLFARIVPYFEI